jgi:hypothetical protein
VAQNNAVFGHGCLDGAADLPNVDLTTLEGHAVHAWIRVPSHPPLPEGNCESSSAGSPQI